MKISFAQIQEITTGAVQIYEKDGLIRFHRLTPEQEAVYQQGRPDLYSRCFCTAGIRLYFQTDSRKLGMQVVAEQGCSRTYFSFDVSVNGVFLGSLDNFSGCTLPKNYTDMKLPLGEYSGEFELGEGVKSVCVQFPWSVIASLKELTVDEGAFVKADKPSKVLLAYGDSITQGVDALHPSNRYPARLADMLGAAEYNKAVAGDGFFPEFAEQKDCLAPDYITVAYGTNDWKKLEEAVFQKRCEKFLRKLQNHYPHAKMIVITPIWRKDMYEPRKFGEFLKVDSDIKAVVSSMKDVIVISGFDLVPKDEKYFSDLRLHPNDEGFEHYFKNLWRNLSGILRNK